MSDLCCVPGCTRPVSKGDLCSTHRITQAKCKQIPGRLWVQCWCGRAVIDVPESVVGIDGVSCGAPNCNERKVS